MRKFLNIMNEIISWVLLIVTAVLLIFSILTVRSAAETGEGVFLFGYRPILVLTGSMEPYMMTNSICITEQVESIDEIEPGDVVTFHIYNEAGKKMNITHRIVSIENGIINTKGDNNGVSDDLMLTMENIDAKVVCVFNQTAWIANQWKTTSGKIFLISCALGIIFAYFALKMLLTSIFSKKKEGEGESEENVVDSTGEAVTESSAPAVSEPSDAVPVASAEDTSKEHAPEESVPEESAPEEAAPEEAPAVQEENASEK